MAKEKPSRKIDVTEIRRTWRIEFMTDYQSNYQVRLWRETLWLDPSDRSVIKQVQDPSPIVRSVADVTASDPKLAKLMDDIIKIADTWDDEESVKRRNRP